MREILQSYSDHFWKGNKKSANNIELFYKDKQNRTTKLDLGTLFLAQAGQKVSDKNCLPDPPPSPRVDTAVSAVNNRVNLGPHPPSPPLPT